MKIVCMTADFFFGPANIIIHPQKRLKNEVRVSITDRYCPTFLTRGKELAVKHANHFQVSTFPRDHVYNR